MAWYASGGTGTRITLLLHGLGATAAVWSGTQRVLEQRGVGRWIAPDLSGHGGSDARASYSVGEFAAELVCLVQGESEVFIVGHSLGVYIGLALASRWFGIKVRGLVGLGPKISWSQTDLQATSELAGRGVRWYATSEEAWTRYRRVSGLTPEVAPNPQWLARGVVAGEQGWRLSQDPRTFCVAGAPFGTLAASAQTRLVLARGENDPMVSTAELRMHAEDAVDVPGTGHNAHVEDPGAIVGLLEGLLEHDRAP